jgi:hypothetical protein
MQLQNTVEYSSGVLFTGKIWRKDISFFNHDNLPFYSNIPRMDEMAQCLEKALGDISQEGCYGALLVVGLLAFFPFN